MFRARFEIAVNDPRPIKWPIKHPYWVTGSTWDEYDNDIYTIVAYADNEDYIYENWPEAERVEMNEEVDKYEFTGRFPKPDWFESND